MRLFWLLNLFLLSTIQECIADTIYDLKSSPAQSYHLKPNCREAVEELYECTDESAALNIENWYPPKLAPLISEYSLEEKKEDIFPEQLDLVNYLYPPEDE